MKAKLKIGIIGCGRISVMHFTSAKLLPQSDIVACCDIEKVKAEAAAAKYGEIKACSGNTSIFLYPGVKFNCIDGLITNFHLPESTLIMLVSALYGYEKTMAAYKVAVEEKYRFFSFGDAMLIL